MGGTMSSTSEDICSGISDCAYGSWVEDLPNMHRPLGKEKNHLRVTILPAYIMEDICTILKHSWIWVDHKAE